MRIVVLTTLAMLAFAGNSLLCRVALRDTAIDAATFTALRIAAGALMLAVLVRARGQRPATGGSWLAGAMLFSYAVFFSYAYRDLTAATGALLLFGAVQMTMTGYGLFVGERLAGRKLAGVLMAGAGLVALLLPGLAAPPLLAAAFMLLAGVSWGVYSLQAKTLGDPTIATAGNFVRAVPFAAVLALAGSAGSGSSADLTGALYAVASGAITSGLGYALWYAALPSLRATSAATVQLCVPAIAALGGVVLLGESLTWHLLLASAAILGGIALTIGRGR
jgi:drug/metabolite transporter (DMT)-like permease